MPRTKETRNPFGSIFPKKITKEGKKITVFDARKRYRDALGNPKEKFKRCSSSGEAQTALINFQNEIKAELTEAKEKQEEKKKDVTFSELVIYFKREFVKPAVYNVKGRKIAGYKQNLTTVGTTLDLLDAHFGPMTLRSITYNDLRKFYVAYSQTKTKYDALPAISTINEKMSWLRRLLSVAVENDWLDKSPFKKGSPLIDKAGEESRNRMLTFEEEARLFAACRKHTKHIKAKRKNGRDYEADITINREHLIPIIVCALDTAMRRADIFNLEWWQIDFDLNVIYLTQEAAKKTKTGKEGVLPITHRLGEILLARFGDGKEANARVFLKFDYKRAFNAACAEAKIENLQFRDLRSTASTRMVLAGNAESQVMKVTRHGQLKTFLKNYTNVDILNAQTIGSNLDEYLEKESRKGKAKVKMKRATSDETA